MLDQTDAALFIIVAVLFILVVVTFLKLLSARADSDVLRRRISSLEADNRALNLTNQDLNRQSNRLNTTLTVQAMRMKRLGDAAEMLWVVLANVSGSDWSLQSKEWGGAGRIIPVETRDYTIHGDGRAYWQTYAADSEFVRGDYVCTEDADKAYDALQAKLDAANLKIDELRDWQATVTTALGREGGAFFEDVPKHVRELRAHNREAHRYLSQLLRHNAPQCEPLPDLPGLATQIDNLIAGMKQRPIAAFLEGICEGARRESSICAGCGTSRELCLEYLLHAQVCCPDCDHGKKGPEL